MTELARAIQDWFNPNWTETRPTVRESSPEAATVGPRKEKKKMGMPLAECTRCGLGFQPHTFKGEGCPICDSGTIAALVEALEAAQAYIPGSEVRSWPPGFALKKKALELIDAALALAKPKE